MVDNFALNQNIILQVTAQSKKTKVKLDGHNNIKLQAFYLFGTLIILNI